MLGKMQLGAGNRLSVPTVSEMGLQVLSLLEVLSNLKYYSTALIDFRII